MFPKLIFVVLVFTANTLPTNAEDSADYLQSAVWNLENRLTTNTQSKRRTDTLQMKSSGKDSTENAIPALSLTKGELAALYEAALAKEHHTATPKPEDQEGAYIHAVVHELNEDSGKNKEQTEHVHHNTGADASGYYYYYYPVNSFMDGYSSTPQTHISTDHHYVKEPEKIHAQYHSHTHQHNVHITSTKSTPEGDKKKMLEPLFMAVSSFIGMAVMFILSIVFLPKFGGHKSRDVKQNNAYGEMSTIVNVIFKAIDGHDCSERIACELGKPAKAFNAYDNRFIKLFRRVSPESIGWYLDGIKKYAQSSLTCSTIKCRRKAATKSKSGHKKS